MKKGELFPVVDFIPEVGMKYGEMSKYKVRYNGEFRRPKAEEWFISGAIPEGYYTKNDFGYQYHIGELVEVKITEIIEIVKTF